MKIGLVAPFEGRYRYVGYDVIYAARLALQEANGGGGVSGYGVELVAYDDGADPAMAAEQARKLDVDPRVVGAIGHFRDATTTAAVSAYADAGLPLVAPTALASELRGSDRVFTPGASADALARSLLERALERAGDDAIVLVSDEGALTAALQEAAQGQGLALPVVPAHAQDWRDEVLAEQPAVVVLDLDPVRAGEVVAALRQAGWDGDVMGGPPLAASDFVAVAGATAAVSDAPAAGATFVTPWPFPADLSGGEAFVAAYTEASGGTRPGPYALPAYRAAWRLIRAVELAASDGRPTRERVSAALLELEGQKVRGTMADGRAGGSGGEGLFWYRIGSDGSPRLLEGEGTSEAGASGLGGTSLVGGRSP